MTVNYYAVKIDGQDASDDPKEWIEFALAEARGKLTTPIEIEVVFCGADDTPEKLGEGTCWRCGKHVESRVELIWLDGDLRNDCPESEDGAPHEVTPPEGWDEE